MARWNCWSPEFVNRREFSRINFGIDTPPFHRLLDLRAQKSKPKEIEPETLLGEYLNEIGKVIDAVDSLEKTGSRT